jgi:haloalkane dehalogenase
MKKLILNSFHCIFGIKFRNRDLNPSSIMMILQTPESRFADLKDFPYKANFIQINDLQMHYIDEGPSEASPVMLLHGVPTWSYLYRHMIGKIAAAGKRVIVPDLIGFGRSDKPVKKSDHSYKSHISWIKTFIKLLGFKDIILFAQDWGSLIGLRIVADEPDLFTGIIISNGMLPTGEQKMHSTFKLWKVIARYSPFLPVDVIISSGIAGKLDKKEKRAYNAPFPSRKYKMGICALPNLVPLSQNNPESLANREAWKVLDKWDKPFLTVFSNDDPITRDGDKYLQNRIPGAAGQNHVRLNGGHFIQEDRSAELAGIIIKFSKEIDSLILK